MKGGKKEQGEKWEPVPIEILRAKFLRPEMNPIERTVIGGYLAIQPFRW
jgi:transposase